MRKRFPILLAANARWPDSQTGGIQMPFNWVRLENKGSGSVDIGFAPLTVQGDKINSYTTVSSGKTRVLNIAGPRGNTPNDPDPGEDWPDQVYLIADGSGTTVMLEVSDHPIVDQSQVT